MKFRVPAVLTVGLLLSACEGQVAAPPTDEVDLAVSVSTQAQTAMGGTANGPASILRALVQQVRSGDNAEAKALLARADEMRERATSTGDRDLAAQAHNLVLQAVTLVFPNAAQRIGNVVRGGLERARTALGRRDAPRIRSVLDRIADLLRQSAAAQEAGRGAAALGLALQASEMLDRLVDHVRADGATGR
jgi:hypothetical protein